MHSQYQSRPLKTRNLIVIIIALILAGCSPAGVNTPPIETVTVVEPTPLPSATTRPTHTATPTPTVATRALDISVTLTPLPTLAPAQAESLVLDLMQHNAGCRLPCWWGIIPGKTSWQDVEPFLASISTKIWRGEYYGFPGTYTIHYNVRGYQREGTTSYKTQDQIIQTINVNPEGTEYSYQLHQLLVTYGIPDEVWVQGWPFNDSREPLYGFLVIYTKMGILARYDGQPSPGYLESMEICPKSIGPKLRLWDPTREGIEEFIEAQIQYEGDLTAALEFQPLGEVTDLDVDTFYNNMKDPEACFETATYLWNNQQ